MVGRRDPARYGMLIAVGALDLVAGALLGLGHLLGVGVLLTAGSIAMLAVAVPRFRRERRRID
ncbi:hypothetical protein [Amnibacterium setariae]|uniref:Uncharacterized protein n=1 Tax=Amnibacterium setariae TaxID=2306585 RepID=A0A3A1TWE3_9MICO|nr:hypothetical protein [Amnibacterium setariae]RIX28129.1 hypothetical protein D1781_11645 [Amnibacterium setariae]